MLLVDIIYFDRDVCILGMMGRILVLGIWGVRRITYIFFLLGVRLFNANYLTQFCKSTFSWALHDENEPFQLNQVEVWDEHFNEIKQEEVMIYTPEGVWLQLQRVLIE